MPRRIFYPESVDQALNQIFQELMNSDVAEALHHNDNGFAFDLLEKLGFDPITIRLACKHYKILPRISDDGQPSDGYFSLNLDRYLIPFLEYLRSLAEKEKKNELFALINNTRKPVRMDENLPCGEMATKYVAQVLVGTAVCVDGVTVFGKGERYRTLNQNRHEKPHKASFVFTSGLTLTRGPQLRRLVQASYGKRVAVLYASNEMPESTINKVKADMDSGNNTVVYDHFHEMFKALFENKLNACSEGQTCSFTFPGVGAGIFAGLFELQVKSQQDLAIVEVLKGLSPEQRAKISGVIFESWDKSHSSTSLAKRNIAGVPYQVLESKNRPKNARLDRFSTKEDFHRILETDLTDDQLTHDTSVYVIAWDPKSFETNEGIHNAYTSDDGVAGVCTNVIEMIYPGFKEGILSNQNPPQPSFMSTSDNPTFELILNEDVPIAGAAKAAQEPVINEPSSEVLKALDAIKKRHACLNRTVLPLIALAAVSASLVAVFAGGESVILPLFSQLAQTAGNVAGAAASVSVIAVPLLIGLLVAAAIVICMSRRKATQKVLGGNKTGKHGLLAGDLSPQRQKVSTEQVPA